MTTRALFEPDPGEPLAVFFGEAATLPGVSSVPKLREVRFEHSSRGDRVPGRLLLPAQHPTGRLPLLLVGHGAGGTGGGEAVDAGCRAWAARGAAVASIDLPLHGERSSPKLTRRVLGLLESGRPASDLEASVWIDFVHQAVVDLRRTLDALAGHPEVDVARTGYAGFGLGTTLGAPFCAHEPRVRAAALALGGACFGPAVVDPRGHVAQIAPRPVLFVSAGLDQSVPRERAEALHEAAQEPREVLWLDCSHAALPALALEPLWAFLARHALSA